MIVKPSMNHLTKAFKGPSFLFFFLIVIVLTSLGCLYFAPVCFSTPLFYVPLFFVVLLVLLSSSFPLSPAFLCLCSVFLVEN